MSNVVKLISKIPITHPIKFRCFCGEKKRKKRKWNTTAENKWQSWIIIAQSQHLLISRRSPKQILLKQINKNDTLFAFYLIFFFTKMTFYFETVPYPWLCVSHSSRQYDVEDCVRSATLAVHVRRGDCARFVTFRHKVVDVLEIHRKQTDGTLRRLHLK